MSLSHNNRPRARTLPPIRDEDHAATVANKLLLKATVHEFDLPLTKDGLVLGRQAPIGCEAFRKTLELLIASPYEHIELKDEIISDLLVRQRLLRRVSSEYLIDFVLRRIKPLMGVEEILCLDLGVEIMAVEDECERTQG